MPWEVAHLPAIVQAWYPGEEGGRAVAKVLFGEINPAGRLPVTFYDSTADLPPFEDYSMSNRTYRYFSGRPGFAFGHGLSYTSFKYSKARTDAATYHPYGTIQLSFAIANPGPRDGDEVPQVYFRQVKPSVPQPRMALCGFSRVPLARGKSALVELEIPVERFRHWDTRRKDYVVEPGDYELLIGGASDDIRLRLPVKLIAVQ
jgi:beta-glucosidase